jgi:hypothetical protein
LIDESSKIKGFSLITAMLPGPKFTNFPLNSRQNGNPRARDRFDPDWLVSQTANAVISCKFSKLLKILRCMAPIRQDELANAFL